MRGCTRPCLVHLAGLRPDKQMDHRPHLDRVVLAMRDTHRDEASGPVPQSIGGASAFELLAATLQEAGFTFSHYEGGGAPDGRAVVLWDIGSFARPPRVPTDSVLIAWTLESPLVAHRAFGRLASIARESRALLTFPGAEPLVEQRGRFVPIFYPNRWRERSATLDWGSRDLLVMVNSNKRAHPGVEMMTWGNPYRATRIAAAATLARVRRLRGELSLLDLYEARLDALEHFSKVPGFSLYGVGWDRPPVGRPSLRIGDVYAGPAGSKAEALNASKFCLCYENTSFPGYITEKIFDCFFAGTIPVYLGAPDVTEHIPSDTFVDARTFRSMDELGKRLLSMSEDEGRIHLAAAARFVDSDRFKRFSDEAFVNAFVTLIHELAS